MSSDHHIPPPAAVAAAMSGGVDSSLAAVLLKEAGYDVVGLTMRVWDVAGDDGAHCCSPQAIADARAICHKWDIPHYVLDVREPFDRQVVQPFIREYLAGRTPNPCVACNTLIKWDLLLTKAQTLGADAVATGHYARVRHAPERGRYLLLRGRDRSKDQSYALWGLSQKALSRTLLPVGDLAKTETRRMARQMGLKVADKRDSQEICFIPGDDYGAFIERRQEDHSAGEAAGFSPGPIEDLQGNMLGRHRGIPFYTIGQRRGLGLAAGQPLYVVDIDPQHNRLIVGPDHELLSRHLWAHQLNWISVSRPGEPLLCLAQIRYNHRAAPATLFPLGEDDAGIIFESPQRAITPGQSVVLYRGEELLGGGIIRRPSEQERKDMSTEGPTGAIEEKL
jgi:tRNA-specific 2-thiouridylase